MLAFIHSFNLSVMYTEFIFIISSQLEIEHILALRDTKIY